MDILKRSQKANQNRPKIDDMVDKRDHKGLSRVIAKEEVSILRAAAIMGLGQIGDDKARKIIVKALNDPEQAVRFTAGYELMRIDAADAQKIIQRKFSDNDYRIFLVYCQKMTLSRTI